jgi:opacity protein-like surface antigen
MKQAFTALCASLVLALPAAPVCAARDDGPKPLLQVYFGVLELDDQSGQWSTGTQDPIDVNFASLPTGGLETEYVFGRGWVHWGLNPGGSLSWKNDDTEISGSLTEQAGGRLQVELDNSLMLAELHLGGYVRGRLGERVTTYGAAGPMVMFGSLEVNNEEIEPTPMDDSVNVPDSNSNDVNLGYYARAGIDFEIEPNQHLGLGVRYLSTELDFDETTGKLDIKGPQYVLTLSAQL